MKTITSFVKGSNISSDDASSIATQAMAGEKEARCLVISGGGSELFIKSDHKIRRATDDEWEEYRRQESKFS